MKTLHRRLVETARCGCLGRPSTAPDQETIDPETKKKHPIPRSRAFKTRMKGNNGQVSRRRRVMDYATAAMEQMELYCAAHPGSPSAVRRPRLVVRGELWVALLGPSVEEGIVGIGSNVTAALRAFDAQYLAGLRPAAEVTANRRAVRNSALDVAKSSRNSRPAVSPRSSRRS